MKRGKSNKKKKKLGLIMPYSVLHVPGGPERVELFGPEHVEPSVPHVPGGRVAPNRVEPCILFCFVLFCCVCAVRPSCLFCSFLFCSAFVSDDRVLTVMSAGPF